MSFEKLNVQEKIFLIREMMAIQIEKEYLTRRSLFSNGYIKEDRRSTFSLGVETSGTLNGPILIRTIREGLPIYETVQLRDMAIHAAQTFRFSPEFIEFALRAIFI